MRFIRNLVVLVVLTLIGVYAWQLNNASLDAVTKSEVITKSNERESKIAPDRTVKRTSSDEELYSWIGKKENELIEALGEPERKNPSAYHYIWWIYTNEDNEYIQFGIENNIIKTVFAVGDRLGK